MNMKNLGKKNFFKNIDKDSFPLEMWTKEERAKEFKKLAK